MGSRKISFTSCGAVIKQGRNFDDVVTPKRFTMSRRTFILSHMSHNICPTAIQSDRDDVYLQIIFDRLNISRSYKPKFGKGGDGLDYQAFRNLYGSDVFYSWFGLDHALMYSAHKVAGGITSVYRQIGFSSEELIRQILQDELGLTHSQSIWSYQTETSSGRKRTLKLDGRIAPREVQDGAKRAIIRDWMKRAGTTLSLNREVAKGMQGLVLEVRQGYKSKDSKRQNADMANAAAAYTQGYIPILFVMSSQIDDDIVERYERGKWLVLRGYLQNDVLTSTFQFMREVVGYDLAAFFDRNAATIREFTQSVLESLLTAEENG